MGPYKPCLDCLRNVMGQNEADGMLCSVKEALDRSDCLNFTVLLRSCTSSVEIEQLHSQLARCGRDRGTFLGNLLVQIYGRFGKAERATAAFAKIANKNVYSWNLVIAALAESGHLARALKFFLNAPEKDACSWTTMLVAYAQRGLLDQAKAMFDAMPERDLVAWNSMIAAYSKNDQSWQAIFLHRRMSLEGIKPDELTIISVLGACSSSDSSRLLDEAKTIHLTIIRHSSIFSTSLKVCNALINLYGKAKLLVEASDVFRRMSRRNCISWTSIIAALNQSGDSKGALAKFRFMELEGVKASSVTIIEVLDACGVTGSIADGRELHARAVSTGWFSEERNVRNAVLSMYGKCGNLVEARAVFEEMPGLDVVTWNAMLAAYARNGAGGEAMEVFQRMKLEGVHPDGITVVCIVCACSHSGLAPLGLSCIASIYSDFGVEARSEHVNCVVDLLGRIGSVEEARDSVSADEVGVRTVLGACRVQGSHKFISLISDQVSYERCVIIFNILSNIY